MKKLCLIILSTCTFGSLFSQKKWTLKDCVDYATNNNISIKQADVQARIAALQWQQAKMNKLPTANFGTGIFPQFGRTIDRTTNTFSNTEIINQNFGLQGNVDIYNFGRLKHNIAASEFNAKAALADVEKAANDIGMNVCTFFLQVVATYQQIEIAKVQIAQTQGNFELTQKRVAAGSLPELNALQLESQLATDSSNYIAAKTSYDQSVLNLKGLLNIDAAESFEVQIPNVESINLENLLELQPENVYQLALNNQPSIKANKYRINSMEKNIQSAKSSLYPSLSGNYSLFTNYTNRALEIATVTPKSELTGFTTVGGTNYNVFSYSADFTTKKTTYFTQLSNNFGQSLGLSLNVPIFNNGQARINIEQSKLNLKNATITETQIEQKLKLDIYTAYSNAVNALQKLNASKKQVSLLDKTFDFANKRYNIGLLSTFDLLTAQTNLQRAKTQCIADQYDYIFKMKLLEFYKGQGLKL
jgi:outer membrane protein